MPVAGAAPAAVQPLNFLGPFHPGKVRVTIYMVTARSGSLGAREGDGNSVVDARKVAVRLYLIGREGGPGQRAGGYFAIRSNV